MRLPRLVVRAVAATKPHVPSAAMPYLLAVRSFRGAGPIVGLPAFRRVLVVAPHPDDATIGCGGTIALLRDAGAGVEVVFATDGERTSGAAAAPVEVAARRRAEATEACRLLGATPRFLALPDGGLAARHGALVGSLGERLRALDPDVVLAPWLLDGHPDHRAVLAALLEAADDDVELWGFETWTPLPPNRVVDITTVVERKRAAVAAHATAHLAFDVGAALGLSRYRSMHGLLGVGHAEAFLAAPARTWRQWATSWGEAPSG